MPYNQYDCCYFLFASIYPIISLLEITTFIAAWTLCPNQLIWNSFSMKCFILFPLRSVIRTKTLSNDIKLISTRFPTISISIWLGKDWKKIIPHWEYSFFFRFFNSLGWHFHTFKPRYKKLQIVRVFVVALRLFADNMTFIYFARILLCAFVVATMAVSILQT